jgi:hypothetical protein
MQLYDRQSTTVFYAFVYQIGHWRYLLVFIDEGGGKHAEA